MARCEYSPEGKSTLDIPNDVRGSPWLVSLIYLGMSSVHKLSEEWIIPDKTKRKTPLHYHGINLVTFERNFFTDDDYFII